MKTVNKHTFLKELEGIVERHISEAIALFQNQSEAMLNRPSETGGWSIVQCLAHLNSYGEYYLPLVNQKLTAAQEERIGHFSGTWLGAYFTKMMQSRPGQKKYKAYKNHLPEKDLNATQVVSEFITQQEDLLLNLRRAQNKNINQGKIPVSVARIVRLTIGDVFQFLITHNERHMQQAKRNLAIERELAKSFKV